MNLNLTKKNIFIAGSSQGIGLSLAESFLEEGANVVISGRNEEKLSAAEEFFTKKYKNNKIFKVTADLSKESQIEKALEKSIGLVGNLECIIGNIGNGGEPSGLSYDEETLEKSFEVNFLSNALLVKHASLKMDPHNNRSIILIGSIASMEDINAPISYSAQKAALNVLVKKSSRILGFQGIRINAILPGNIHCKGGLWDKKLLENREETMKYIKSEVPLQSLGSARDVSNLALFLASEKAKFITGSLIVMDGGQTRSF